MKQPNNQVRLQHMLDAANKAAHLLDGQTRESLNEDEVVVLAVIRLLEVLGEAANGISNEFQKDHPQIPWKEMIGARNHLIHGYFDVDLDIVWQIIKTDLPRVILELEKLTKD